jgi:two-component system response regulator AtoC
MKVLIIDDEESMRHMLSVMLKRDGYDSMTFADAEKALVALGGGGFDFVLCDIKMPGMDGLGFLRALKKGGMDATVIMMSAYGTIDNAIECMKLGAYDYISKPFKADEIILALKKAEERERLKREVKRLKKEAADEYDIGNILTADPQMLSILEIVKKVADYSSTILIAGESGTGKELVARAIHYSGKRASRPFVAVNCGAIPAQLLESELFGHVKGAFTDASRDKIGLFKEADSGTLFLDEVGELPMELQVKLLRALQESEIRRVGDTKSLKVDTRVVAATVKNLKSEIESGNFREDLFYRLNVIELKLPPLRERPSDIEALSMHFIKKYSGEFGKPVKELAPEALDAFKGYAWPGNIRELENVIERAMILEESAVIKLSSLPMGTASGGRSGAGPEPCPDTDTGLSIKLAAAALEKSFISKALVRTNNNRTKAAKLLQISHRALLYKIKDYKL